MWSIEDQSGDVFDLIRGVVLEEMLHMGLACNMLAAIGGTPVIVAPGYPATGLPGGVRPGLEVYLSGLTETSAAMFMQIELPEDPLAELAETFATIGAFYDAIAAAFTALDPPIDNAAIQVASAGVGLKKLATLADVQAAITTIKEQGEGTSTSPFDSDELAHYYRFGEIFHGKLIKEQADGTWDFNGDDLPLPRCFPVARIPKGGYPNATPPAVAQLMAQFDETYGKLIVDLQKAWSPNGTRIASASDDRTVQIWDATTGETIFTYRGHTKEISSVAWSPNGTRIASAGYDATVHVWNVG